MEKSLEIVEKFEKKRCISYGAKNFLLLSKEEYRSARVVLLSMAKLHDGGAHMVSLGGLYEAAQELCKERNARVSGRTTIINIVYKLIPVFLGTIPKSTGHEDYTVARLVYLTREGKIWAGIIKRQEKPEESEDEQQ